MFRPTVHSETWIGQCWNVLILSIAHFQSTTFPNFFGYLLLLTKSSGLKNNIVTVRPDPDICVLHMCDAGIWYQPRLGYIRATSPSQVGAVLNPMPTSSVHEGISYVQAAVIHTAGARTSECIHLCTVFTVLYLLGRASASRNRNSRSTRLVCLIIT